MYLKYLYIFRTPKPAISQMGGVGVRCRGPASASGIGVTSTLIPLPPTSGSFILPGRVFSNKSIPILGWEAQR